jgi:acetyltransferase
MKLRPIRPEDANRLAQLIADLAPEDTRLRFFAPIRSLAPAMLARLTQIDYDREMAFVLHKQDDPDRFLAVVRLAGDPDNYSAEFAIVVRSDLHRRGLGRMLMTRLIDYAKARGLSELVGDILADNTAMRALCTQLGFTAHWTQGNDAVQAILRLGSQ